VAPAKLIALNNAAFIVPKLAELLALGIDNWIPPKLEDNAKA
jgi:hypothetical protein